MAEGLGIGSALLAIISSTARIALIVKEAGEVPQHILRVRTQVRAFRLTAIMLKDLLIQLMHNDSDQPSSSKCNINRDAQTILYVNDLAEILFESMSIITELEKMLEGMGSLQQGMSPSSGSSKATNIAKWLWQEKDILELLQSLESHKSSLDLIVGCLTCKKLDQVQREQAQIFHLMKQKNTHIYGLQLLEDSNTTDDISLSTSGIPAATATQPQISYSSSSSTLIMSNPAGKTPTVQASQHIADANFVKNIIKNIVPNIFGDSEHKDFVNDLLSSRVYNKALRKLAASSEDMTISEFQSSGWSVFRYNLQKQPRPFGSSRGNAQLMFSTPRVLFSNSQEMRTKALIKAVYEGKKDIVRALLSQLDANIEDVCKDLEFRNMGSRPLHIACRTKQMKMVKLLLEYGADIEATDGSGNEPLNMCTEVVSEKRPWSIKEQEISSDNTRPSREQDADTVATNMGGNRPLHIACYMKQIELVKLLLEYGADIEATNKAGNRPLHIACCEYNIDMAKLLLNHGADIEAVNMDDNRPLHITCSAYTTDTAKLLLNHGADIEATKEDIACLTEEIVMAILLLENGADIKATNKDGNQPLHIACRTEKTEIARLLLKYGAGIEAIDKDGNRPLHIACRTEKTEIAKLLLKHGADIEATDKDGNQPLHIACYSKEIAIVILLLENGADIKAMDKNGNQPLHIACSKYTTDMAKFLLNHGADIEATDKAGNRPLHIACSKYTPDMVKLLLDHGADIEATEKNGNRPLHLATWKQVALVLLQHNVDRTARNKAGELSKWHNLQVD